MSKIVIIGPSYPLRSGGLATYNERLAKEFIDNGHEVLIYTFSLQYPSFLFPGKTQYSDSPPPSGLNIKVTINSVNPITWFITGKEIKKLCPDIVVIRYWLPFMGPCFGTILRIIRLNRHTKIISIADNIIPHEKHTGDRLFTQYFAKSVDGFIAMSKSVLNDISLFSKKPKAYNPHPLYDNFGNITSKEIAREKLGLDINEKYLLFFGFIRNYKGLDLLIQAISTEKCFKFPFKLIIAGEFYEDPKPYFNLISKFNLYEKIILRTDFVPDDQVADYFNAADLIVQPYKTATQSGVTQIAYHFNKPSLVTNVGGLSEIIAHKKTGYVVNPVPEEIAESIIDFYTHNRYDEFLPNILVYKKKFSWHSMLKTIFDLTDKILNNDKRNHSKVNSC